MIPTLGQKPNLIFIALTMSNERYDDHIQTFYAEYPAAAAGGRAAARHDQPDGD